MPATGQAAACGVWNAPFGVRDLATGASDLGWAPGEWPQDVLVADRFGRLLRFTKLRVCRDRDGDVTWVAYCYRERHTSHILRVYND